MQRFTITARPSRSETFGVEVGVGVAVGKGTAVVDDTGNAPQGISFSLARSSLVGTAKANVANDKTENMLANLIVTESGFLSLTVSKRYHDRGCQGVGRPL